MPQKGQDLVIEEFKGIDTESDPTNLPKEVTNDLQNVYPILDGRAIRKRPGISTNLTDVARSGGIYHMLRGALRLAATVGGPDVLFMVYGGGGGAVNAASYLIDSDSIEDYGATSHATDPHFMASLVLAGLNRCLITAPEPNANWNFIEHFAGTTPFYRLATYAAPATGTGFPVAAWHRQHHWVGAASNPDNTANLRFSDFDDPVTFPAANTVDVDPRGKMDNTAGFFQIGDALYIGKSRGVFILTGANDETFAIDRTRINFGFHGMRSWDILQGGSGIGFVHIPRDGEVADDPEFMESDNLATITGLDGEVIGDSIRSLLQTFSTTIVFAASTSRTKDWPSLDGTLLVPQNRQGRGSAVTVPAIFRNRDDGSFWRWSLSAGIEANTFEVAFRDMYIGCQDGHIRKFDTDESQDDGVNFDNGSYWQTPPLWQGTPHNKWVPTHVVVHGTQTSGGTASLQVATDFGALGSAITFTLSPFGTRIPLEGDVTAGRFQQIRITLPNDGVDSEIRKIVIGVMLTDKSES